MIVGSPRASASARRLPLVGYQSTPSNGVPSPRAHRAYSIFIEIESRRNRTDPSPMQTLAPPVWKAYISESLMQFTRQPLMTSSAVSVPPSVPLLRLRPCVVD